jgi:hypothetical protein
MTEEITYDDLLNILRDKMRDFIRVRFNGRVQSCVYCLGVSESTLRAFLMEIRPGTGWSKIVFDTGRKLRGHNLVQRIFHLARKEMHPDLARAALALLLDDPELLKGEDAYYAKVPLIDEEEWNKPMPHG